MRILVVIYHKVGDKWVNSNDVLAGYRITHTNGGSSRAPNLF
jgi:hypothetical protein